MSDRPLPPLAALLGLAGLIPFLATALSAASSESRSGRPAAIGLITYSAIVLSFLGGIHWGFLLGGSKDASARVRLGFGLLPGLIGWAAILLSVWGQSTLAIALLTFAFVLTAIVESRAQKLDFLPQGYMVLRWLLTIVAVAVLTTVLVLRLVGGHLLF